MMYIKQLKAGGFDNFCYLVGCPKTKKAVVIDPGGDTDLIFDEAAKVGLKIVYIFNTHNHGDHTVGDRRLKEETGAPIVMHALDAEGYADVDIAINEEKTFQVGEIIFTLLHTPGHTPGGLCFYADGNLFTGDTLFVGDSGRTDLRGGDRSTLAKSLRSLMELPEDTIVWPGHDYGPMPHSTLAWEKKNNVNAKEYGFYQES
jgi:hydroxyacylglutathione hydrolase